MEITAIAGIIGLLMIVLAFALNLSHKLNVNSKAYLMLNLLGSILLAYYALILDSIPFLILQLIWALASLIKLIMVLKK